MPRRTSGSKDTIFCLSMCSSNAIRVILFVGTVLAILIGMILMNGPQTSRWGFFEANDKGNGLEVTESGIVNKDTSHKLATQRLFGNGKSKKDDERRLQENETLESKTQIMDEDDHSFERQEYLGQSYVKDDDDYVEEDNTDGIGVDNASTKQFFSDGKDENDSFEDESEKNIFLERKLKVKGETDLMEIQGSGKQTLERKTDVDKLVETLTSKINEIRSAKLKEIKVRPSCYSKETIANSCQGNKKCLRMTLPEDVKGRVTQLVNPKRLQLTDDIRGALQGMAKKVIGHYDVIILTAASSNHFYESQAMMKNVHENVFPHLKNFTFLFYDLGLSAEERETMVKNCKCQVLDFPFDKFPDFMHQLECFSWKPVLIKAHTQQANVLIWADASVRFHQNASHLDTVIEQTRQRGLQIGGSSNKSPFRTFRNMYHYFGDEPCAYLQMGQAKATIGFYGRDPFVDRAILEPWVACAVHQECMCSNDPSVAVGKGCAESKAMAAGWESNKSKIVYGLCHRFDQSAISIILHKLYQGYFRWVMVNVLEFVDFRRGDTSVYFPANSND